MSIQGEQVLMRTYLESADRAPRSPTYELLVRAARQEGLAGATVLRGILGLGSHGLMRASAWTVVEHVPVIVEIVDSAERIRQFIEGPVAGIMIGGMITLERANVMMYRQRRDDRANEFNLGGLLQPLSTVPQIETSSSMKTNQQGVLLRVFIGESDKVGNQPLYEVIVQKARELGLAGATVLRGSEGFGANSVVHKASLLEMSTDLPIVIEIVDTEEKVNTLLPHLSGVVDEGMVTMEHVQILLYRHNDADAPKK